MIPSPYSRAPDARYLRALWLRRNWGSMRSNQRNEDALTYGYARFLVDLDVILKMGFTEQERYMSMNPVPSAVYWLSSAAADTSFSAGSPDAISPRATDSGISTSAVLQRDRSVIKALVLADASREFIAAQLNYPPEVIGMYEGLHWDIRGHMGARAWLHNYVFPEGIQAEISSLDFERAVLRQAYAHGLTGLLDYLHLSGHVMEPRDYVKRVGSRNQVDLTHKTSTAIQGLAVTNRSAPELITVTVTAEKHDREMALKETREKDQGGPKDAAQEHIMEAMTGLLDCFKPLDSTTRILEAEERLDDSAMRLELSKA